MRTGMTFVKEEDGIRFYGEISATDLMRVKLDQIERMMLAECKFNSPTSDHLLALETLFRRIEEQFK